MAIIMPNVATSPALQPLPVATGTYARAGNALLLAVAAPIIAELLTSSTPPREFFVPWIFGLFVLFYGGSAILIREAAIRWNTGWRGVLILGCAFGILLEGISTRAFFDPHWASLGPMAGQGYWRGVNWTWMFDAICYHAVFSTALPILLVYQIAPKYRREPWLNGWGLAGAALLWAFGAAVFIQSGKDRYPAPRAYLAFCCAAIAVLVAIAHRMKALPAVPPAARPVRTSRFAILSFCATLGLVLQVYALPHLFRSPWPAAAALAILVLIPGSLFVGWSGGELTPKQSCALLTGALGCFALLGFFQEVNPSRHGAARGISFVSAVTVTGLYFLQKKAARNHAPAYATAASYSPALAPAAGPWDAASRHDIAASIPRLNHAVSPLWRLFEILVALMALVVTSPVMLALAILIRRGTPGPALFFQDRVGVNGRIFKFVKFRTLYADAKERFPELYAYRYTERQLQELKFKIVNDPRVTPEGKWMRTTTLDELPNFWNVLCGDMALVGPRPEIPEMVAYYQPAMLRKFSVRPGVTGLAQISGRGRLGFYETVELDLQYVMNQSLFLDLKIIALTLYKMITRDGAF